MNENKLSALFGFGKRSEDTEHFTGDVYVKEISGFDKVMLMDSVTFAPGCINSWHVHQVGQTLFVTDGRGWYQEEGKPARELSAGDIVDIPAGVKHRHGAAKDGAEGRTLTFMVVPVLILPRFLEMDGIWLSVAVSEFPSLAVSELRILEFLEIIK